MKVQTLMLAGMLALPLLAHAQPQPQTKGDPDVNRLNSRLRTLDMSTETANTAAYERLQARQAVSALMTAKNKSRAIQLQIAERRVQAAEISARTEVKRREIDRLDRERSDLLVEVSRQDAARARQEAEQARLQARIQAEEAERLRMQAEEEMTARQEAEIVLDGVAGDQAAKLRAARQKQAELERKERELMKSLEQNP